MKKTIGKTVEPSPLGTAAVVRGTGEQNDAPPMDERAPDSPAPVTEGPVVQEDGDNKVFNPATYTLPSGNLRTDR